MQHFRRVLAIAMADEGRCGRAHEAAPLGLTHRASVGPKWNGCIHGVFASYGAIGRSEATGPLRCAVMGGGYAGPGHLEVTYNGKSYLVQKSLLRRRQFSAIITARKQVAVAVESDLDGGMTHACLHRHRR
jgi:hypothetical protein